MSEEPDEGAWAFDVVGALKAKVDAVKEAEAALEERARELQEEREGLEAARARLEEKERALLRLDEDVARDREAVHDRQGDIERGQSVVAQEKERLAANEARLKEWAQSLHAAEQQIVGFRDELRARQAEVAMKLAQFHDRLIAVMRREDAIVEREAALAASLERLKKVNDAILSREKVLASQVQTLDGIQKEWSSAVRKREEQFASALAALQEQSAVQGTGEEELAGLIKGLQDEVGQLAAQRQALLARERKVMEFEQSLTAVVGTVRPGMEGVVLGTYPPFPATAPASDAGGLKGEAIPKTPKGRAMEKMTRVLELAKRAQASGRDNEEVRDLLRQIRKAYEGKTWEDLEGLCERALEKLSVLTTPSS